MLRRLLICLSAAAMVLLAFTPAASGARTDHPPGYTTKVLVRGAPIHGANGLAVDTHGRLLVASANGAQIDVVDRHSGRVLQRIGHASGVDAPDDVAVGPDGSIYWTDIQIGQVGRLAPNGTVTKQSVAMGMNPIAFSPSGRLFVAQAFFGDGLYELDPNLVKPPRVVIPDSGPAGAPWPNQLNGFDFGPDGMLYSPQPYQSRIVRINPNTGAMTVVADKLPAPPTSVEFDAHGRLYASLVDGTVIRVNPAPGSYTVFAKIHDAVLDNMTFDHHGQLYVSDSDNGAVYKVSREGDVRTLVHGGLILPGGLALTRGTTGHRSLFVANVWSLPEYNPWTGRLVSIDRQSRAGGGIVAAWSVAPFGQNVVIASWMANAVQVWDPAANKQVALYTDFAVPVNAIQFRGNLVVAALGTGSVVRQTPAGVKTTLASGLMVPSGLAATRNDLWVADQATGKVWQVVSAGTVLTHPKLVAEGLRAPEGMAVDRDGSLLVVEAGAGRVSRIDPATGHVTTVAGGLQLGLQGSSGAPPTWALSSVVVAKNGTLFVTGDVADVIYRLTPTP
ncbi:MAG TPA: hypothetical protein VFJ09_14690 [Nocardioidaceae bacterium]|nr:hypothetical protein [Nocardioidaceae bacterium]